VTHVYTMFCWGISLKTKLPPRLLKVWETTEQSSLYCCALSNCCGVLWN